MAARQVFLRRGKRLEQKNRGKKGDPKSGKEENSPVGRAGYFRQKRESYRKGTNEKGIPKGKRKKTIGNETPKKSEKYFVIQTAAGKEKGEREKGAKKKKKKGGGKPLVKQKGAKQSSGKKRKRKIKREETQQNGGAGGDPRRQKMLSKR